MTGNNIKHTAGWPSDAGYSKRSDSAEDSNNVDSDPIHAQFSRASIHSDSCNRRNEEDEYDDSDYSDNMLHSTSKQYQKTRRKPQLPPIGVFWDIENCQVPRNKSAGAMVQKFRNMFFDGHREVEFLVVCDVTRESSIIIDELHNAQVSVIHVSATCKNAADEKLRQALRRFGETYSSPATVIVLTSDINFASDLNDLRYRKNFRVILIHNAMVAPALVALANEHHNFAMITDNLEADSTIQPLKQPTYLIASNLPLHYSQSKIKSRLCNLVDNCGGRIIKIDLQVGTALLRFPTVHSAERAQKRLKNADVFGFSIDVSNWFDAPPPKMATPAQGIQNISLNSSQQSTSYPQNNYSPNGFWNGGNFESAVQSPKMSHFQNYQNNSYNDSNVQNGFTPFSRSRNDSYNRPTTPQEYDYAQPVFRNGPDSSDILRDDQTQKPNIVSANNKFHRSVPKNNSYGQHVDLFITNLDPSLESNELRLKLTDMLKQYVVILNLTISTQSDGSWGATIRVGSQQEAKYAISQLHHCKIGYRRISISCGQATVDQNQLKDVIIALLKEVPDNRMPLFKLIELLANRYHMNVSVYEVTRQRDICRVTDESNGRIVSLTPEIRSSPIPNLTEKLPYGHCQLHHHHNGTRSLSSAQSGIGWAEHTIRTLPNVRISLYTFCHQLHAMLQLHPGHTMPLVSFPQCYGQQFGMELPVVDDDGVPLEHLVTCVRNVALVGGVGDSGKGGKWIVWQRENVATLTNGGNGQQLGGSENGSKDESLYKGMSREIAQNTQLLCRELVDLLRTRDKCQLLLDKFIPMYHHHFGRQCRVATYGFTRLVDLFESEAISAIVHIMGTDDTVRILTLTHQAQMRRFTAEVLRMLKSQLSKQVTAAEFPALFEATFSRKFNPIDYGLCELDELLQNLPQNTFVLVRGKDGGLVVTIPKKEPTKEEMEKTKRFAVEVVQLLKHSAHCKMQFNKFVPSYHHHFGHQCKVADYGFAKLIELFEAIPDTVKIEETSYGERTVCLTLPKAMEVLGGQVEEIIRKNSAPVCTSALPALYMQEFGYPLKIDMYECKTIDELVHKMNSFVKISRQPTGIFLQLANEEPSLTVALRTWSLLLIYPYCMPLTMFLNQYSTKYGCTLNPCTLKVLVNIITIRNDKNKESYLSLTPLYELAAKIYQLLYLYSGQVQYSKFTSTYQLMFGTPMRLLECGVTSIEDLFVHLSFLMLIRGSLLQTYIVLNQSLVVYGIPMPTNTNGSNVPKESLQKWPMPPMPPMPELMTESMIKLKRVPPPKPDTPSATSSTPWGTWDIDSSNFSIPIPALQTPKLMGNLDGLYSPAKFLLPANKANSVDKNLRPVTSLEAAFCPSVNAPEPQDIPMPDTLLIQGIVCDDSNDSGVANNSNGVSDAEESPKTSLLGAKRKLNMNQNTN